MSLIDYYGLAEHYHFVLVFIAVTIFVMQVNEWMTWKRKFSIRQEEKHRLLASLSFIVV
jgi:hypothetical protein